MGDTACDFCGQRQPSDQLVPVQRRSRGRACRDCAILMETRADSFVVEASRSTAAAEPIRVPDAAAGPDDGPLPPDPS